MTTQEEHTRQFSLATQFLEECAGQCIEHEGKRRPMGVLRELVTIQAAAAEVERLAVELARAHGHSWADIGAAIGITRQAAQKRHDK